MKMASLVMQLAQHSMVSLLIQESSHHPQTTSMRKAIVHYFPSFGLIIKYIEPDRPFPVGSLL